MKVRLTGDFGNETIELGFFEGQIKAIDIEIDEFLEEEDLKQLN